MGVSLALTGASARWRRWRRHTQTDSQRAARAGTAKGRRPAAVRGPWDAGAVEPTRRICRPQQHCLSDPGGGDHLTGSARQVGGGLLNLVPPLGCPLEEWQL